MSGRAGAGSLLSLTGARPVTCDIVGRIISADIRLSGDAIMADARMTTGDGVCFGRRLPPLGFEAMPVEAGTVVSVSSPADPETVLATLRTGTDGLVEMTVTAAGTPVLLGREASGPVTLSTYLTPPG